MARELTKTRSVKVFVRKKKCRKIVSVRLTNFMLEEFHKMNQYGGLDYLEEIFRV